MPSRRSTSADAPPAIEVDGVDFSYGRVQVLFEVSITVPRGQSVAILGPNAAGKSTLLNVISGVLRPSGGAVRLNGRDVTDLPPDRRGALGLVQVAGGRATFPTLTLLENLKIGAYRCFADRHLVQSRVDEVLDLFPALQGRLSQVAGTLSGGEQQMMALGRTLMADADIVMIDELSLGLAPIVVQEMIEKVQEIAQRGKTILVVEQSLPTAAALADDAYLVEKGEVRFAGKVRELLDDAALLRAGFFGTRVGVVTAAFAVFGFDLPTEVILLGLIGGLTYGLLGVGIALVYRSSRVINLAQGEIGALSATMVAFLALRQGANYWVALGAGLAASTAAALLTGVVVGERLARAPRLMALVATIGAAQLFFVLGLFIPRPKSSAPFPTPFHAEVKVGNLLLNAGHFMILGVAPIVVLGLAYFLKRHRVGVASRALAENVEAAQHAGLPARRITLTVWAIAGLFAGLSATLKQSTEFATAGVSQAAIAAVGPGLLLRGLTAATVGRFTNLPLVFAGGIGLGVVEYAVLWNYPTGGFIELVILAIVLAIFIVNRRLGDVVRGGEESSWALTGGAQFGGEVDEAEVAGRARVVLRVGALTALVAVAFAISFVMSTGQVALMSSVVIFAMMALSLVVLTGFTGQVSLGQFAFVALGALVAGRILQLGFPGWVAPVYAMAVSAAVALLIGLPALRIRGLFLAVPTLGFSVAASSWLFQQDWLVHTGASGTTSLRIPRPTIFGIDLGNERPYYAFCLLAFVVVALCVHRLRVSGVGRQLISVKDNAPWAAALSVSPRRARLLGFVISGMIAGLAGYFYGGLLVSFDQTAFGPDLSLGLIALAIFGGITTVSGAVIGALWLRGVQYFLGPAFPDLVGPRVALLFGGIGLLGAVVQFPNGLASVALPFWHRVERRLLGGRGRRGPPVEAEPVPPTLSAAESPNGKRASLVATDVVVQFGAITAVDNVSIEVYQGEIVGMVGPNGAGKTTLFDVLSGRIHPQSGQVLLDGRNITDLRPEVRAELGLGRSFQQSRLFDNLTLAESLMVALERAEPSEVVPSVLALPPALRSDREKRRRAEELVEVFGLGDYVRRSPAELSTGTRKVAELACLTALGARVLILDEPSSGVSHQEIEGLQDTLRQVRAHLDAAMVVVDHDMPMVIGLVDRMYGLVAGQVIVHGTPNEVIADPQFAAAYMGSEERASAPR